MDTLAIVGLVLGLVGVLLSVASLTRQVPTLTVGQPVSGRRIVTNAGPQNVVVVKAWVEDAGGTHPITSKHSDVTIEDYDGAELFPRSGDEWGSGAIMGAQQPIVVSMNLNRGLFIRYRLPGTLGRTSRATLQIFEGP